jgi:negative regulator of sigma E activity
MEDTMSNNKKNREILSAYLDNEIPNPWKESVDKRIATDPESKQVLSSYGKLKDLMHQDSSAEDKVIAERQSIVWDTLQKDIFQKEEEKKKSRLRNISNPMHGEVVPQKRSAAIRGIQIPLPWVAAAAVFLIVLTVLIQTNINPGLNPAINEPAYVQIDQSQGVLQAIPAGINSLDTTTMPEDGYVIIRDPSSGNEVKVRVQDLAEVYSILNGGTSEQKNELINIPMPENLGFLELGEPQMVNKDDMEQGK